MVLNFITQNLELTEPISTSGDLLDLPIRTKGDIAISRLKIKDILFKIDPEIKSFFSSNLCHLDQILLTNLIIWTQMWGLPILKAIYSTGLLNDFETFATKAAKLSSFVKRFPFSRSDAKQRFSEFNTLTGYMQVDFGNFSYEEELQQLAHGGNEHDEEWTRSFNDNLDKLMTIQPMPEFVSFEDYVKKGYWLTSGSSSIGKVEWSYDNDSGKFKARKNMLTDLYTAEELYEMALNWDAKLQNRVFIKDELAKRRLAVSSNVEAYFNQGYLLYLFGHGFKNYSYITLDEKPNEQHFRNVNLIKLLKNGSFALPWDFKGFDRQPRIEDIEAITNKIGIRVMPNVPNQYKQQVRVIIAKNKTCYYNNYLYSPLTKQTVQQTGGLPSGIRPTSLIGNIYNANVTDMARAKTREIIGFDDIQEIKLRGDDTYIISKNWFTLLVFRYAYAALNITGENSKFGIMQNVCEFLRTEISTDGVRGWTNRAIPSVTQRKPWNPQPWTANNEVTTVANNIYLLERRSKMDLEWLHQCNKVKWSKYTHQSYLWLHLPKHHGGLGLYRWQGWKPNCKLPLARPPLFTVPNTITDNVNLSWLKLTEEQKADYQKVEFSAKIAADDIPGPQKHLSRVYVEELRKLNVTWKKQTVPTTKIFKIDGPTIENNYWPKDKYVNLASENANFPVYIEFVRQHQIAKRAKVEMKSLMQYTAEYYPEIYKDILYYEARGWHRTDAINLACGSTPTEPTKIMNPLLTPFVSKMLQKSGLQHWRGRDFIANKLYSCTTQAVEWIQAQGGSTMYAF
nr:RNA-dependent RNA polymerase [buhirugu virus 21]